MPLIDLPAELLAMIIAQLLGPCFLRRHVVTNLQQMSFIQQPLQRNEQYTSHAHDSAVRRNAGFDSKELPYYAALCRALQHCSRSFELLYLDAERIWLRKPPMDYRTFKHFCDNPQDRQYHDREYLVLELFPETDFFDPPPQITSIDATDRVHLRRRTITPLPAYGLHLLSLDQRIYNGLMGVWSTQIPQMPPQVQRVRVIAKTPSLSTARPSFYLYMTDPLDGVSQALRHLERQGRVVNRGMLLTGLPIRD